MPQMMPISWLILFLTFSATFIMFNLTNYFSSIQQSESKMTKEIITTKMNWKW
uniref:ATP synthase complex subunit 8 n=1 Tax=Porotermes adamsoni TaxID=105774 RepID=I6TJ64_9NEOP|nr:ATP synthase F0 subunit 8 [Porotermes adamsoni]AFM92399.1 ATP synthase F0 subunit 8 [Porotermes adamsoni]WHM51904.1 ATP synthase F0 subunit 8 [Porotermes adamsoni]